jgi:hypothetical protein
MLVATKRRTHISGLSDVYARNCYRLMLDINQSEDHVANEELYKQTNKPLSSLNNNTRTTTQVYWPLPTNAS